eukprot:CAMPEP_0172783480 /NCGR_PEP_ID=MMETSP1074-20121228/204455_1 /TAXON_ID=2916 /ORGANISM="Ceratium fusus, Strain PA161109" /LENGTH=586 /DNA_ID=CAMNT_0013620469 /DNA_START=16 /DNA_END=1778 /DNA_ORIENTATION=+
MSHWLKGPCSDPLSTMAHASHSTGSAVAPSNQVIVLDAGSSGTRVHVFNILPLASGQHVPLFDLSVHDSQTLKLKPGLSHFGSHNDLAGAEQSVKQLLEFARRFVQEPRRSSTPVLLKATAGLRALPKQQADALLERIRILLARSGFEFQPGWADIIKGREEAGLAWVAANFLGGTFGNKDQPQAKSMGIIELGGGSMQVVFQVDASEQVSSQDKFVFTTARRTEYHLYAHSYLGFGLDYAQKALRLSMPPPKNMDPCYPVGYVRQADGLFVQGRLKWLVRGAGDDDKCKGNIKANLFKGSKEAPGQYLGERPLRGKLLATQNFFYLGDRMKLPLDGGASAVDNAAQTACRRPIQPLAKQVVEMESGSADANVPNSCFGLSYQSVLLQALRAAATPGVEVEIANTINGREADWALGAAVVHSLRDFQQEPAQQSHRHSHGGPQSVGDRALVMLASFVLMAALLGFAWRKHFRICRQKRELSDPEIGATVFGAANGYTLRKNDFGVCNRPGRSARACPAKSQAQPEELSKRWRPPNGVARVFGTDGSTAGFYMAKAVQDLPAKEELSNLEVRPIVFGAADGHAQPIE